MNIRSFMVLGAITALGLSACILESTTGSSSTTGGGGDIGQGGEDPSGGAGGGPASSSSGGATCNDALTCADVITPGIGGDPKQLCDDNASGPAYDEWFACLCDVGAVCEAQCKDTACAVMAPSTDCQTCVNTSCSTQRDTCNNN
jgi:hypothetical protein